MARKRRIGIVGLGRIFDLNVRGYLGHPEAEVVALCDTSEKWRAQRAAEFPGAFLTDDFAAFLKQDLDFIDVLTPHPLHAQMTIAALQAGADVSVQKPMAMTLAECDAMIGAAKAAGRRLKLFENFVFYPPLVRMKQLMAEGAIGRPVHFRMKVVLGDASQAWHVPVESNAWRQAVAASGAGGPLVFDHGHHMMAVALWLFGDVVDGFACIDETLLPSGRRIDAPASLQWRHAPREGIAPVHGMWDVSAAPRMTLRTDYYPDNERFEIQGEEGILQVTRCSDRLLDEPVLTLYRDGEVRSFHNLESDWGNSFRLSTLHHLDVLAGRQPQMVFTGEQGRQVLAMHDMFARANASGAVARVGG
ncbi:MAG: Gfo/Idh/MocA family oxidoreductase [Alphaproteobacteria bacterium]|nr:Gfo/Idh/MocA family oxidoreductase [Alphaproteobacteria bacterium]